MLTLTALNAIGNNARGDAVIEYLLATEKMPLAKVAAYYVGADMVSEETMRWRGSAAAILGLAGTAVSREAMIELAAGYSPDGKKTALCQNAGVLPKKEMRVNKKTGEPILDANGKEQFVWKGGHQVGYDCVFNAPKSVSLLFAMMPPEERGLILQAHRDAADRGLEYMESKIETRRGKGGKEYIGLNGAIITSCDHVANRNLEPHLHMHNLFYGVAIGADGKWGAFESSEMMRHQKAADAVYMSNLAENIRKLGYGIEQVATLDEDGNDTGLRTWKIAGIEEETIKAFSTRTGEIKDAQEEGMSHQEAWRTTRKHKKEPSPEELFATWEKAIPAMGQVCDVEYLKSKGDIYAPRQSDDDILAALHKTKAIVHDVDIQWAVYQARAGESFENLESGVQHLKDGMVKIAPERQAAIDAGKSQSRPFREQRYSDPKIVSWEQEVLRRADERRDDTSVCVLKATLDRVVAQYQKDRGFTLSAEQREALDHLCVRPGGHAVMAGVAGAGKTTVAEIYKLAFEANGQHLIGAAIAKKAASKLQEESGMEAMPITALLNRLDKGHPPTDGVPRLNAKSVVVLDEAGMVDTEAVRRLMRYVDAAGGKIILQGDMKQLQPIGAGAGMALVSQQLGQAELTEIRRQKNEVDRATALQYYDRDENGRIVLHNNVEPKSRAEIISKSNRQFDRKEKNGQVESFNTRPEAMEKCVSDWLSSKHAIDERLLLAHDHADITELNKRVREGLRQQGHITGEDVSFRARRGDRGYNMDVALGDLVRLTKNDSDLGVVNGDMATVEGLSRTDDGALALELRVEAKGGKPSFAMSVDTSEWNHLSPGYCRTVHDAQGQGKAAIFHFANAKMMDNQSALVAFTRLTSDRYCMYGAELELEQIRNRMGRDNLKQNATQEGLWIERARQAKAQQAAVQTEQIKRAQQRQRPGLTI